MKKETGAPRRFRGLGAAVTCALAMTSSPAWAATYHGTETVHNGGVDPARAIDIVFVPVGYSAGYLGQFRALVDTNLAFRNISPFSDYQTYFNVHRIDIASTLDEESEARAIALANAPDADTIIYVRFEPGRARANYGAVWLYSGDWDHRIVAHELGHALASLGDEYVEDGRCPGGQYSGLTPSEVNLTTQTDRAAVKWRAWFGSGGVDMFEGGRYCRYGIWRPRATSIMNDYVADSSFDPVGREKMAWAMNAGVTPFVRNTPEWLGFPTVEPARTIFSIDLDPNVRPQARAPLVQWYLDNVPIDGATGTSVEIDLAALSREPAYHYVETTISDPDTGGFFRTYPQGRLIGETGWIFKVSAAAAPPEIADFAPRAIGVGDAVTVTGSNLCGTDCDPANTTITLAGGIQTYPISVQADQLTFVVPEGAISGPFNVTTSPGGSATSPGELTIYPAPVISGFSPEGTGVGRVVVVWGSDLCVATCNPATTTITLAGGGETAPGYVDPYVLWFFVPEGALTGPITVTTPGGSQTSVDSLTIYPPPVITSVSDTTVARGGWMAVFGEHFCINECSTNSPSETWVKIGTSMWVSPYWALDDILIVHVPTNATTGPIQVSAPGGIATGPTITVTD